MSSLHITAERPVNAHGSRRLGPRLWAGAIIVTAGLGLIALGGLFLVGVLETLREESLRLSAYGHTLIDILYVMAFACFGGAAVVLFLGVRGMLRVLKSAGYED